MWYADLPPNQGKPWRFRMLVVNGQIAERARLPETGFFRDENPDFVVGSRTPTQEELTTLKYRAGDLGSWLDVASAEIRVYRIWDESLSKLSAVDEAARVVRLITPLRYPAGAYQVHKYEVLNVREGLKRPGQWYLDYGRDRVYYWPRMEEQTLSLEAWAPVTEILIRAQGTATAPVRGVWLRNVDMTLTDAPVKNGGFAAAAYDGAITVWDAVDVGVEDVRIRQVAGQGVRMNRTSKTRVLGCEMRETGACGVAGYDNHDAEVADCVVSSTSLLSPPAAGIEVYGDRVHLHRNEVHDAGYSGTMARGDSVVVEYNRVYRVMQKMADGAAFYTDGTNGVVRRKSGHPRLCRAE